jgi:hypothetical protein
MGQFHMAINEKDIQWDSEPQIDASNITWDAEPTKRPVTPMGERFATGFKEPFLGMGQRAIEVGKAPQAFTTNPLINLMNVLGQKSFDVGLKATGQKPAAEQIQQDIAQTRQNYVAPEGVDWARMGGNITNPTTFMSPTNAATSILGKIGTGAVTGAGYSALAPTMSQEELQSNLGTGALTGGLFSAGTSALGRVISPNASTNAEIKTLKDMGVTPTIGQTLGGRWNLYEEKLTSLPFVGDIISNARTKNEEKFRTGLFNTILKNVDDKLPKTNLKGRDPLTYTKDKIQSSYDNILNKLGAVKVDDTFLGQADELSTMLQNSGMGADELNKFTFMLNPIKNSISEAGFVTSESLKKAQSNLSKQIGALQKSDSVYAPTLSQAAAQLKSNLDEMIQRHASTLPKVNGKSLADDLQRTNKAWAMFKRTEKAASATGAPMGEFTPTQFASAVRQLEPSKGRYATGDALLQDVSDAAKNVIGNKISNANPYIRPVLALGAGTAAGIPNYIAATIATYGVYNPVSQKLISDLITKRPEIAPAVREFINQQSPRALAVMPSLLGKNNEQ